MERATPLGGHNFHPNLGEWNADSRLWLDAMPGGCQVVTIPRGLANKLDNSLRK